MRIDLGPTRERQNLRQQIGSGRTRQGSRSSEMSFRSMGVNSVPNPMTSILRQQDSLRLTSVQADSIAVMNRRYTYRSDSLWAPVGRHFASLPARVDEALSQAALVFEPKIQTVRLPGATLRSKTELESWLDRIREQIVAALGDGPVIPRV